LYLIFKGSASITTAEITGTEDDVIFNSQRWSSQTALTYNFPLDPEERGKMWQVDLLFAETYTGTFGIGKREFDVFIEGTLIHPNLDIYSRVGPNAALILSTNILGYTSFFFHLTLERCGSSIEVRFQKIVENPTIAGIRLILRNDLTPSDVCTPSNVFPDPAPVQPKYNYSEVLTKVGLFYEAMRAGDLTHAKVRRLAWRGNTYDDVKNVAPYGADLSGGFMESSNRVKFGLPIMFTWYFYF
jgi:hypothetical protein